MTPRQFNFVREYLRDMNATQAMIRAGYSRRTAQKHMARLMSHPEISRLIDAALADRDQKVGIEATEMLEGIANAARSELLDARANLQAANKRIRSAFQSIGDIERLCARPAEKAPRGYEGGSQLLGKAMVSEEMSEPEYSSAAPLLHTDYRPILPPYPETIGSAVLDYDPLSEN